MVPPVLERVGGQPEALAVLAASAGAPVHAYLFVGPPGSGKRDAAQAFAAALVCADGGCGTCPSCTDALAGAHSDVVVVERVGAAISIEDARRVAALAQRTPRRAKRQVIVLDEFHLVDKAAPALLKTIEEPPPSTVFLVLADALPAALTTIASRCVTVPFRALDTSALERRLIDEGVDEKTAAASAAAAGGRLDRARLLAGDPGFVARQRAWRAVPERLDGTGATVVALAEELVTGADDLVAVLRERQDAELSAAAQAAERAGERAVPGRQAMIERHRREQRRVRTDELRAGLATLAGAYRGRLTTELPPPELAAAIDACTAIDETAAALVRNPNEALLLQALLLRLEDAGRS